MNYFLSITTIITLPPPNPYIHTTKQNKTKNKHPQADDNHIHIYTFPFYGDSPIQDQSRFAFDIESQIFSSNVPY